MNRPAQIICRCLLSAAAAFLLLSIPTRAAGGERLAVKAGIMHTGTGAVIKKALMLIEDGRILSIIPQGSVPEGFPVLDLSSRTVIPGLVDAHSHIGELPYPEDRRSSDINESSRALTPGMDIRDSLNFWSPTTFELAAAAGVTTIMALPGSSNVIGGIGVVLKTCRKSPEKRILTPDGVLKIALGMNPKSGGKSNSRLPKTRMGVRYLLWQSFLEAKEYSMLWDRYNRDPENRERPETDPDKEPLRKAIEGKIPVHIHCARADDIMTACSLAEEFGLRICLDHGYEAYLVAPELARKGIPVITGPGLTGWKFGREMQVPVDLTGKLIRAGVKTAIMTDAMDFCDLLLQAAFAVKLGLDETEALKAITSNAAEIIEVAHRVGSLERGKDADFVVLDGPPFEVMTRIIQVYAEGEPILTVPSAVEKELHHAN